MTRWRKLLPWLLLGLGIVMTFHPTLLSGLTRMQTDPGDTRFVHYGLEHFHRWAMRLSPNENFFDPPFFYPARNVNAYSDMLIGAAPLYSLFRVFFIPPDYAYI